MNITPLDIQQKQFQKVWNGFHQDEVRAFLDSVRIEMEDLIRLGNNHKEHIANLEKQIEEQNQKERSIQDSLLLIQRISEDIKQNALKDAELVMTGAKLQAEQIVAGAQRRLSQILDEIQTIKHQRAQLISSLHATIETHAKLLEITEKQLEKHE